MGNIDSGEALEIVIHLFGAMRGRNPAAKSFDDAFFDRSHIIFGQVIRETGSMALFATVHNPD